MTAPASAPVSPGRPARRSRCRCGHLLTHHMQVAEIPGAASFRLDPSGGCAVCGDGICRKFSPTPA